MMMRRRRRSCIFVKLPNMVHVCDDDAF